MTPTKRKIIDTATQLFNEQGLANVRLQQIADEVGISIGNLAYHFNNKESIVATIFELFGERCAEVLSLYSQYPNLLDFDLQLNKIFELFTDYRFCFLDILEVQRSYPEQQQGYQVFIRKLKMQIEKRIEFNLQRGIFLPHTQPNLYTQITELIMLTILNWLSLQITLQIQAPQESDFKQSIWLQLQPYLTEKGKLEFNTLIVPLLS